jgi:hypothetical protein
MSVEASDRIKWAIDGKPIFVTTHIHDEFVKIRHELFNSVKDAVAGFMEGKYFIDNSHIYKRHVYK